MYEYCMGMGLYIWVPILNGIPGASKNEPGINLLTPTPPHMSHSLNSLKGLCTGSLQGLLRGMLGV